MRWSRRLCRIRLSCVGGTLLRCYSPCQPPPWLVSRKQTSQVAPSSTRCYPTESYGVLPPALNAVSTSYYYYYCRMCPLYATEHLALVVQSDKGLQSRMTERVSEIHNLTLPQSEQHSLYKAVVGPPLPYLRPYSLTDSTSCGPHKAVTDIPLFESVAAIYLTAHHR